jgi:Tfp pilus assembly protein PilF
MLGTLRRLIARLAAQLRGNASAGTTAGLEHGRLALQRGDTSGALTLALEALRATPPASEALDLAYAAWDKAGEHRAAAGRLAEIARANPSSAAVHRVLGAALRKCGDLPAAQQNLERATLLDSGDYRAWHSLGMVQADRGDKQSARASFERALKLKPDFAEASYGLGTLALDDHEFDAAIARLQRVLEIDPGMTAAQCNLALALYGAGYLRQAEQRLLTTLARDPANALARFYYSYFALGRCEWQRGWEGYEHRLSIGHTTAPARLPAWRGESLAEKRILVYGEQGLGDQIMFASCLPDLAALARRGTVLVDGRLQRLFARSFPALAVQAAEEGAPPAALETSHDLQIAFGSLPRYFRTSDASFPRHHGYLRADAERVRYWRARLDALGPGLKIGISWRGGTLVTRRPLRSIELPQWLPILRIPGAVPVSLQYDECSAELAALRETSGVGIAHWPEAIADYDETAALVSALDLVISVCTSVVHLTGALGKLAWVMVPVSPEWRYSSRGTSIPWYPSVRLFRQQQVGDWRPVVTAVAGELAQSARA